MWVLRRLALLASVFAIVGCLVPDTLPAYAGDNDDAVGEAGKEADEVDTENIFGFTEGADVNERGERELSITLFGAFGRLRARPDTTDTDADDEIGVDEEEVEAEAIENTGSSSSHYRVWEGEAEFEYGVTNNLTLGIGGSVSHHDIENTFGFEELRAAVASTVSPGKSNTAS